MADTDLSDGDSIDAPKRDRQRRALWRLCGWGGAAAIALTALALTTQTESGNQRLLLALSLESQPQPIAVAATLPPRAPEPDVKALALEAQKTQALEAQVRALAADRDRLTARIAGLERNLEDMTGSIKRQAAAAAETPPSPPPAVEKVASAPPALAPLAMPASSENPAPWPATAPPPADTAPLAEVPLPPVRVAAAPSVEPAAARKAEVGVDLGGAPTLDVLNARWLAVKANFGPMLAGLHPLAAHVRRPGSAELRLLAGPLPNYAAATALCARFTAARVTCRPAKFDGEQIAAR